jgi:hypothetical protein
MFMILEMHVPHPVTVELLGCLETAVELQATEEALDGASSTAAVHQISHTCRNNNFHNLLVWLQARIEALDGVAVYHPKEAAKHAQRLQAYVAAAAAKAAGQLEPGLKNELYEALGLAQKANQWL